MILYAAPWRLLNMSTIEPGCGMSVVQAAHRLGVSKQTVYRICEDGELRHTRVRRRITITPEQLEQYRSRSIPVEAQYSHLQ